MAMNISCKFKKASYNIFFVRAVTVKSLYTLRRRRRNKVKSIVSTGCYNNIKQVISTFRFARPRLMLKEGPRSNLTTSKDSQPIISYKLVSHCKPLGPIISEL